MPSDTRFVIVRKLLEQHGWHLDRVNGSHHFFKHPTLPSVSIPVHRGKVKHIYVHQIEKAIKEARQANEAEDQG